MKVKMIALKDFDIGCEIKAGDKFTVPAAAVETYEKRGLGKRMKPEENDETPEADKVPKPKTENKSKEKGVKSHDRK